MIAALPMYDWPELQKAHDEFWATLHEELNSRNIPAPEILDRNAGEESHWLSEDLLVGQTCGYPFSTTLKGKVQYLGTPIYKAEGCTGPYYSSAIIANADCENSNNDWSQLKFAYNSRNSWSGYRIIEKQFGRPEDIFADLVSSGSHRDSARMVANGRVDLAAIDAVCWHHLQRQEPDTAQKLTVLSWSDRHPALPFITALHQSDETVLEIQSAISTVLGSHHNIASLALAGFEVLDVKEYQHMGLISDWQF